MAAFGAAAAFVLTIVHFVGADVILTVNPINFRSPVKCDAMSNCDFRFKFCLSPVGGSDCRYFKSKTGDLGASPVHLGTIYSIPIHDWQGGFHFRLSAIDKDLIQDDLITELTSDIYVEPSQTSPWTTLTLSSTRGSASVRVKVVCDNNFYGRLCDVRCDASADRYTCDPSTGARVCKKGWGGELCDLRESAESAEWIPSELTNTVRTSTPAIRFDGESQKSVEAESNDKTIIASTLAIIAVAAAIGIGLLLWTKKRQRQLVNEKNAKKFTRSESNDYYLTPNLPEAPKLGPCEIVNEQLISSKQYENDEIGSDVEEHHYEEISPKERVYLQLWESDKDIDKENKSEV